MRKYGLLGFIICSLTALSFATDVKLGWDTNPTAEKYVLIVEKYSLMGDRIIYSAVSPNIYIPGTNNTYTISNLTSGSYRFKIYATNQFGISPTNYIGKIPTNVTAKQTIIFEIK